MKDHKTGSQLSLHPNYNEKVPVICPRCLAQIKLRVQLLTWLHKPLGPDCQREVNKSGIGSIKKILMQKIKY